MELGCAFGYAYMYNVCMYASYTAAQANFSSTYIYIILMYVCKQCSYAYKKFFGVNPQMMNDCCRVIYAVQGQY